MKKQMFKILVILLSPIYLIIFIFEKMIEYAIDLGKPIVLELSELIEDVEKEWNFFEKNKK